MSGTASWISSANYVPVNLTSGKGDEHLPHRPIRSRASRRYLRKSPMVLGLLVGEVEGSELNLISHAGGHAPSSIDYPDHPVFHTECEGMRPDDQRGYSDVCPFFDSNDVVGHLQAFPIEDQLPGEKLRALSCGQRAILLGEIDLDIRQGFQFVGAPDGSCTFPAVAVEKAATAGYLIPNPSHGSPRPISDLDHTLVDVWSEPGRPDYRRPIRSGGAIFQPQARPVQNELPHSCRS